MKKKVLILCTGNSCRSIMAEALLNAKLGECLEAYSSGVEASGTVNPHAKALLQQEGLWREEYHSKRIEEVLQKEFDLVVTVCDHAHESCPSFPKVTKTLHISFEDPSGKAEIEYEKTLHLIEKKLLPKIKQEVCTMEKKVFKTQEGVKINFFGGVEKKNIVTMVENCQTGQCECMSDATKAKIQNMEVSGSDGDVALNLEGDVSVEEIQAALAKSKVLND